MGLLENKTALVTGGSRGIGEAIVKALVDQGANVAFTYRSSGERAEAIEKELSSKGAKVKAYKSDASSFGEAESLVKSV